MAFIEAMDSREMLAGERVSQCDTITPPQPTSSFLYFSTHTMVHLQRHGTSHNLHTTPPSPYLLPVVAFCPQLPRTLFFTPRLQLLSKVRRGLINRPCGNTTGDQMLKLWWQRCEVGRTSRLARCSRRRNIKQLATPCDSFAKPVSNSCKALSQTGHRPHNHQSCFYGFMVISSGNFNKKTQGYNV